MISAKDFLEQDENRKVLTRDLETGIRMGSGFADGLTVVEFEGKEIIVMPDTAPQPLSKRTGFAHYAILGLCSDIDEVNNQITVERITDLDMRDRAKEAVSQIAKGLSVVFVQNP